MQQKIYFSLIKQALKAKGITYAQLATALGISEVSIKRLFKNQDCKISRLLEICDVLDITFDDLVNMQTRNHSVAEYLPKHVEIALAKDLNLFHILVHLLSDESIENIRVTNQLQEHELYIYLRKLEKLELIQLISQQQVRLLTPVTIRWRLDGPLAKAIIKANQKFIALCFEQAHSTTHLFSTQSRMLTRNSAEQLREQLQALIKEFDRLSAQDKLFYSKQQLQNYKLVAGMGEFCSKTLFPIQHPLKSF